jgi:DEAD/DEAH box helicase domain-containing protein
MRDTLVLDIETKKSFAEVGGEKNIRDLGISIAGTYSYAEDRFLAFEEHELGKLEERLAGTGRLIGFNIRHFDLRVIEPYLTHVRLEAFAVTDIFEHALKFLGHRVGLEGLSKATLGKSKSGHGLEALEWFRQGRVEEVKRYCLDDVRLTRDLYEYGKKYGHLRFESFADRKIHSIPVSWEKEETVFSIADIVHKAFVERRRLAIEYLSSEDSDGKGFKKRRLIDVYGFKPRGEIEAYCHLRQGMRVFRLDRILKAELTQDFYRTPADTQSVLFS